MAKAAGVSPSTVTRVIQNKSTISDETKKTRSQGYEGAQYHPPNLNARSLQAVIPKLSAWSFLTTQTPSIKILSSHLSSVVAQSRII